jgi:virginiamycin B lyase
MKTAQKPWRTRSIVSHVWPGCVRGLALTFGLLAARAKGDPTNPVFTEYPIPTQNAHAISITAGPDGNLWFAESFPSKVAKITLDGLVTEYSRPYKGTTMVKGSPDGHIWVTEFYTGSLAILKTDGSLVADVPATSMPSSREPFTLGITTGPDNQHMWFTNAGANTIGRIALDGTALKEFPVPTPNGFPKYITAGPDGAVWFTEEGGDRIGRIGPDDSVKEFKIPSDPGGQLPEGITSGPDGNLWFVIRYGNNVVRMTPGGEATSFPLPGPNRQPQEIITGPDGALWFTETEARIGRITTSGTVSEYRLPDGHQPWSLTLGPDQAVWFTDVSGNRICRLTAEAFGHSIPPPTIPTLSLISLIMTALIVGVLGVRLLS